MKHPFGGLCNAGQTTRHVVAMDVRCPSCGTDYELDDARVPDTGLPVKCSKCGHVFRAMRPVAPPGGEPPRVVTGVHSIAPEWMIRRTTGEMVRFRELTTLQRWIVERKVGRNDEISKTGKKWEKLGNIPELAVFFQVVDSQTSSAGTPPPPPQTTNPAMMSYPAAQAAAEFRPIGPDPLSETMPDSSGIFRPMASNAEATPLVKPEPRRQPVQEPEEHRHETVRWDMSRGLPDDVREEYEISGERPGRDELMPRRVGMLQIIGGLSLLLIACGGLAYVLHPSWVKGMYRRYVTGTSTEAVRAVDEGYAALDPDTTDGNNVAIQKFEAAIAFDDDYAAAHAGLAEALITRAELTRDEAEAKARALSANPVEKPDEVLSAIADGRTRSRADLDRATAEARKALELDDAALTSNRAMLDVLYLSGEKTRQEALILQAQAASPNDARLSMILGGIALRDGNLDQAKTALDSAIAEDAKIAHAKYLRDRLNAKMGLPTAPTTAPHEATEVGVPGAPTNPSAPPGPGSPMSPANPGSPSASANPGSPSAPTSPGSPSAPTSPGSPSTSANPGNPSAPTNPGSPSASANPGSPSAPTSPGNPSPPANPGSPSPSTSPGNPNAPASPTTASSRTLPAPTEAAAEKPAGPKAPDDPTITFAEALARGEYLRDHDKPGQALRYYERAAIINVTDPDAHLGVGFCNLDLRQSSAAITAFKKALELSPRFSDAHFGLAEAFRARGNKLYAIRYYKSYLDIAPHGPEADVARAQLERLEDDNSQVSPSEMPSTPTPPPPPPAPEGSR